MKTRIKCGRSIWVAVVLATICGMPWRTPTAVGQILYVDEFDGTHGDAAFHPGGVIDVTSFRAPFGGTTGDDFVGRTNFRFTLPQDGVSTAAAGSTDGKVAVLNLDTYNPNAAGTTFLGTDVISKRNYAVGGGLSMTTRMRVQNGIPGGLVAAPFLYDVSRNVTNPSPPPATIPVRDEIDHEIITNNAQSAGPDDTLTNVWNDGNFASPGSPVTISNPSGFDVTQFHDYRTDWTPTSVKYYIDNTLVRTETSVVPDDPMRAHVNFWAPDSTFASAYNAGLTPSATSPGTTYKVEIDRMQIERLNTTVGPNLLQDPSFENFGAGWTLFNNASVDFGCFAPQCNPNLLPQEGQVALKTFGPFHGGVDASGAFQNVPASPGQQFEGSVWANAPSGDAILGKNNYTNITLSFVDSLGNVIGSVNFSPGTNERNTPIFDGRDANMPQNQWVQYTVDAVAPAGTVAVRESLFFIQLNNQGGAVWFDNASLNLLTANVVALAGDYNGDGRVNAADYVAWRKGASPNPNSIGDYNTWRMHFGESNLGSGNSSANSGTVPEASVWMLALIASVLFAGSRRLR